MIVFIQTVAKNACCSCHHSFSPPSERKSLLSALQSLILEKVALHLFTFNHCYSNSFQDLLVYFSLTIVVLES